MTSAEALSILQRSEGHGYISWDDERCAPDVVDGTVVLDGAFSEQELRALLVFFNSDLSSTE